MDEYCWESDRPFPEPNSLSFWEHHQRQFLRKIVDVVVPILPDAQRERVLSKARSALEQPPRYRPYITEDGAHRGNMAQTNLWKLAKMLHLDDLELQVINLAWCVGTEISLYSADRTPLYDTLSLIEGDTPMQANVLAALFDCEAATIQRDLIEPPYKWVMLGVLSADTWNLSPRSLVKFAGTATLVDTVHMRHSHLAGSLIAALLDLEFDALPSMNATEVESEIEDYGSHRICMVYLEGCNFKKISAESLVVLVHWLSGLRLKVSDMRLLDHALDIYDVRQTLANAACEALEFDEPINELLAVQSLYLAKAGKSASFLTQIAHAAVSKNRPVLPHFTAP